MNIKLLVVAISIVLLAVATEAQEQRSDRELMAKLEQMRNESEWKAQTLAGGPKLKWLLHQSRLNRLIDRLKAGQTVDPKEIDELLKEHSR